MRVLIVSDTTGHMRGGVPAATKRLIQGLRRRGHEIGFCSDIPLSDDPAVRFYPWDVFDVTQLSSRLSAAIDDFGPEIVHVISMSSRGLLVAIALLRNRPWVLTCHSIPPYERKLAGFHDRERLHYAIRWLLFLANSLAWRYLFVRRGIPRVIAHSDWVAAIVQRYGFPRKRTTVIALGNESDAGAAPPAVAPMPTTASPLLVTVGGVAHTKGQHDAVAAIAELRKSFPGIRYRIVGEIRDQTYVDWLRSTIERLRLTANVQILSTLSHEDKQRLLAEADVYVQPSHEEGFCLAFLEAAACVPRLVATDAGAMRRICGDDPGARVVAVRDPASMAVAIETLLRTRLPPDTLAKRLDRLNLRFGWQQYTDAHERLYGTLIAAEH